jgi:hypothetical protein
MQVVQFYILVILPKSCRIEYTLEVPGSIPGHSLRFFLRELGLELVPLSLVIG